MFVASVFVIFDDITAVVIVLLCRCYCCVVDVVAGATSHRFL